jgi:hypothetical protein
MGHRVCQFCSAEFQMNGFKVVFFVLAAVLIAWIVYWCVTPALHHPVPQVFELGNGFEGNLQLPAERIQAAFSQARGHMLAVNTTGTRFEFAGEIIAWLSFAATAVITLIVGFHGRQPQPAESAVNTDGLPARAVRLIGILAAIAAISTAASSKASSEAQTLFKRADEIRELIVQDRGQVLDAKDASSAQAVLDDLALKSVR